MSWFDLRNMHTDRQNMYAKIYLIDTKTEKHNGSAKKKTEKNKNKKTYQNIKQHHKNVIKHVRKKHHKNIIKPKTTN